MMLHPTITLQLATQRQQDLIDRANRHRQARAARAARSRRPVAARTRLYILRRVRTIFAGP
jgi:hypothetical protein